MQEVKGHKILGAVRRMKAVDMEILADILITIGKIGMENEKIEDLFIETALLWKETNDALQKGKNNCGSKTHDNG